PLLFLLYLFCFLDRTNVSMAALRMNDDLQFSAAIFGFGAGVFFLGYSLFEVPRNLILAPGGARRWTATGAPNRSEAGNANMNRAFARARCAAGNHWLR